MSEPNEPIEKTENQDGIEDLAADPLTAEESGVTENETAGTETPEGGMNENESESDPAAETVLSPAVPDPADFMRAIRTERTQKEKETAKKNRLAALCIVLAGITALSVGLAVLSTVFGFDKVVPFAPADDDFTVVEKETVRNIYVRDGLSTDALAPQELYDKVMPSIVTVTVYDASGQGAYGTGFFISEDGYIATAAHVVAGFPNVYVTLSDGSCRYAETVAYDETSDVGLIKIDAAGCKKLEFADSSAACAGDTLYAVGSPSGPTYAGTLTSGHVSFVDRLLPNKDTSGSLVSVRVTLQIDSSLNPGNSGGPLLNDKGQVLGIVSSKLTNAEGMCFGIPSNGAVPILNALKNGQTVTDDVRVGVVYVSGKLGVTAKNGTVPNAGTHAVEIVTVDALSGLYGKVAVSETEQVFITAIGGADVVNMETLSSILMTHRKGETVTLSVVLYHTATAKAEAKEISVVLS